ncbi:SusC/RagA family TonB-linked outer membrane protein [Pedobacter sp. UYEF25]
MKLTTVLIFGLMLQVNAKLHAQKLTLNQQETSIDNIFKLIEQKTGYVFLYDNLELNTTQKVSINIANGSIQQVLNICFKGTSINYKIIKKTIILKKSFIPISLETTKLRQAEPITGKITDEKGLALPGVSVKIKESGKSTVTNDQGNFSVSAQQGETLVLSYIGYQTQELKISGTSINVILRERVGLLDQVVVVGYGTQKKKDITGAISVITSKDLDDRPSTQFGSSIEGKAAGVQVIRSSGQPQAGFAIRIRGTSTITSGSEPLYIVDGVPMANVSEINTSDIESLSILKDASSAAIYGSSGANGVVLITTKRGKNQKTEINFETYNGYSKLWNHSNVLNAAQYKSLMEEMGQSLDASKYTADTDWQKELFRTANMQKYQLSLTGGNENTTYYMSGAFLKQDGVVLSNTVNKVNFKLNLDHKISNTFKVGTSLSYNRWYDIDVSESSRNGTILNAILGSPVIGIFNPNGQSYTTDPFRNDLDNPVGLATGTVHNYTNNRFNGNVYVEANILKGLKLKSMFGYEKYNSIYNYYADPTKTVTGRTFNGQAELSQNNNQYWISENTLAYTKSIEKHNFNLLAGYITSKTNSTVSDISTHNFANPTIMTVNGGSIIDNATGTAAASSTASFISRIGYDYDGKYLLTANLRADASSVFGPDNRWGYFPSFSGGWRISKEDFFQTLNIPVNELKLRASWGIVGNSQIPAYSYLGTVQPSGSYVIGDQVVAGYLPVTLGNPTLKWETTKQTDIGIDIGLFNSRLLVTADYYYKKTTGLLLNSPVPRSSGYGSALKNVGDLENKGFEFEMSTRNLTGPLVWNSNFNISFNRNKILNIEGGIIYDGPIDGRGNSSIAKAGLPLGSFFGYVAEGVDPKVGNLIYKMANPADGLQTSDQQVIGNGNPKFSYGFSNDLKYKQWSVALFIQGVQGNDIFNATRIYSEGMWEPRNQSAAVLNRWTTPGQITNIPRQDLTNTTTDITNYNSLISSRFIENGSYLRLKSVTLGYNLPEKWVNKASIKRLKLYVTSENLLTFTKYSGLDPEVSAFGTSSNIAPGVDFGTYPQTRDIIFGLDITF